MTSQSSDKPDFLLKIVLVGDSGTGKTNYLSVLNRGLYNPTSRSTIGVEFGTKSMIIKEKTVKAHVWDSAGLAGYGSIVNAYYKGAIGVMLMYDVTNLNSFKSLSKWVDEIQNTADKNVIVMVLANKCEVPESQRIISTERGKHFAKQHNFLFNEVSACDNLNIQESFEQLISKIINKLSEKEEKKTNNKNDTPKTDQKNLHSNPILLSSAGLKNIIRNDVEYFTFKFGPSEMKIDKLFAQFLSPLVSRILLSDPTVDSLNFDYLSKSNFPNFDQLFNDEIFGLLHKISRGESIEIDDVEAQKLMLISILLYNQELFDILCQSHPINFDIDHVEAYVQQAMVLNQMKEFFKEDKFDISEVFDEMAKKFDLIDKKCLKNLPKSVIYTVISNKNLVVESEDSLFDFVMDVFESDESEKCEENDEYNLMLFLEKIELGNLTEKKCAKYIQQIDPNKITGTIWKSICRKFEDSEDTNDKKDDQ